MRTIRTSRSARLPAALAALLVGALVGALPSTAHAAPPAPPSLSITVDDGQASAAPSDRLTYTLAVTNLGTRPVKDLTITQALPDGATLEFTDPRASGKAPDLTWLVDVGPGKTMTMRTTVTVAETLPQDLLRLAVVGCARTSAKAAPLVCASDSDQLPAGAVADEQRLQPEPTSVRNGTWWPLPGAVVLGGLVLATVAATLLLLRRRGRGQHVGEPGRAADDTTDLVSSTRR